MVHTFATEIMNKDKLLNTKIEPLPPFASSMWCFLINIRWHPHGLEGSTHKITEEREPRSSSCEDQESVTHERHPQIL